MGEGDNNGDSLLVEIIMELQRVGERGFILELQRVGDCYDSVFLLSLYSRVMMDLLHTRMSFTGEINRTVSMVTRECLHANVYTRMSFTGRYNFYFFLNEVISVFNFNLRYISVKNSNKQVSIKKVMNCQI